MHDPEEEGKKKELTSLISICFEKGGKFYPE
jgi:hypothetical protein